MIKLFLLLAVSLSLLSILSCANFQTSDFEASITLPASQDCYGFHVMSGKETRLPAAQCVEKKKRAVFIDSTNWKLLRTDIQKNCLQAKCKQIVGAFDDLFLKLDAALQKVGP